MSQAFEDIEVEELIIYASGEKRLKILYMAGYKLDNILVDQI